jgi:gliding motility-associated-like protein
MKFIAKIFFIILIFCSYTTATAQYIIVDNTQTPQQLIENVLVKSSCAVVSNISGTGDFVTPGKNSYGYFNKNGSNLPFTDGVILCTSTATKAIGPIDFDNNITIDSNLWLGDKDMEDVLGIKTINATTLEFDFVSTTNFLSFNYFFASKEYQANFPCQYSDGFAFLIKEKGSTEPYKNLAVIPDTNIPVSSITIHKTIPNFVEENKTYTGCPEANAKYYEEINATNSAINFNGQTTILTAQTTLIKGKTYHIKLVIADSRDQLWNSAVFLQAGSFSPKLNLGQDRTLTGSPVCFGETVSIDPKQDPTYDYKWFRDNLLLPEKTPTYTATQSGKYSVEVTPTGTTCAIKGELNLEFSPEIILNTIPLLQCDDNADGKTVFDLSKVEKIIKSNNTKIDSVVFYESLDNAKNQKDPIATPISYQNKTTNQSIYCRVTNSYSCTKYGVVQLKIANNTIAPQNPIALCDQDDKQDGLYQFDMNALVTPQLLNGLPTGLLAEYYLNESDALVQKNIQNTIFKNTIPNQQVIYARIINGSDCYAVTPITLIVNTFDPLNFEDKNTALCDRLSLDLEVATGFSNYKWSTGEGSAKITVTKPGIYTVEVTNENECKKTKKFHVKSSGIATITNANVSDFAGNQNTIFFQYTGNGDYEFSLDGNFYQDNPLTNVGPGKYTATARDKNGCGISAPFEVTVLDYPRFFTPNGDGNNDFWKINNLDVLSKTTITIFDRYGKLIKQLNSKNASWDGNNNGIALPAADYWFSLELDNRVIKGHFSLKR